MKRKTKKPARAKPVEAKKQEPVAPARRPVTQEVKVGKAKGRPLLVWVGKRPLDRVTAFPAQLVETYNPTGQKDGWQNLLFHGDNKEVLAWLLANGFRGKVNLAYADPPFNTGLDNYVRKVRLRNAAMQPLEGEPHSLVEQMQYANSFAPDFYLQMMYERSLLVKEVLHTNGIFALRIDYRYAHYVKVLLDEVLGPEFFVNEILVSRQRETAGSPNKMEVTTELIFVYARSAEYTLLKQKVLRPVSDIRWTAFLMAGERHPRQRVFFGLTLIPPQGQHYPLNQDKVDKLLREHYLRLRCRDCRALHYHGGSRENLEREMKRRDDRFKFYDLTSQSDYHVVEKLRGCQTCGKENFTVEYLGSAQESVTANWTDIPGYAQTTGYPTENSEELLKRIIATFSVPGDLVVDPFIGSGTAAAVAQQMGRRWIGCDINKGAIQTTAKRLQTVIEKQLAAQERGEKQGKLIETRQDEAPPKPASLAFSVHRVNDYDLQIQHNEAVNLACEHIGVDRKHTDRYFDGKLGKRLVKIVPFNHPLSPLDLEELKNELKARSEEDRDITVACLGKEAACDAWLEEWNRMRRQGSVPNQIEVIELRTDPKYGKFFIHKPARAEVKIARLKDKLIVEITDFLSPTIIERLSAQEGVLKPQITDWRSMVDTVMIDTAYDGEVFNIVLADVPEKKSELVVGRYELPAPKVKTMVAVKLTDMLGEDVVVTQTV